MNGGGGVKVVNSRLRLHKTHGKPRFFPDLVGQCEQGLLTLGGFGGIAEDLLAPLELSQLQGDLLKGVGGERGVHLTHQRVPARGLGERSGTRLHVTLEKVQPFE